MKFSINSEKWLAQLTKVVEQALEAVVADAELIPTLELVEEAREQVQMMRAEVRRYDADRRNEPWMPAVLW